MTHNPDNRIRRDDWTPAFRDCECHNCRCDIRAGEPTIRVSYRGAPRALCADCAMTQIGGEGPTE